MPGVKAPHDAKAAHEASSDGSRCEYDGRADREPAESVGSGSIKPNIRRVYRVTGQGEQRRRVLACREVDTNNDGMKDVFRQYDQQGQPLEELADSNYDGVIDTWIRFDKGQIIQIEIDEAWDGQPDERRHYVRNKLIRIERDTNQDGDTDVWEYYVGGHLDRIGTDLNGDGRVDRWSRDAHRGGEASARAAAASDEENEQ